MRPQSISAAAVLTAVDSSTNRNREVETPAQDPRNQAASRLLRGTGVHGRRRRWEHRRYNGAVAIQLEPQHAHVIVGALGIQSGERCIASRQEPLSLARMGDIIVTASVSRQRWRTAAIQSGSVSARTTRLAVQVRRRQTSLGTIVLNPGVHTDGTWTFVAVQVIWNWRNHKRSGTRRHRQNIGRCCGCRRGIRSLRRLARALVNKFPSGIDWDASFNKQTNESPIFHSRFKGRTDAVHRRISLSLTLKERKRELVLVHFVGHGHLNTNVACWHTDELAQHQCNSATVHVLPVFLVRCSDSHGKHQWFRTLFGGNSSDVTNVERLAIGVVDMHLCRRAAIKQPRPNTHRRVRVGATCQCI